MHSVRGRLDLCLHVAVDGKVCCPEVRAMSLYLKSHHILYLITGALPTVQCLYLIKRSSAVCARIVAAVVHGVVAPTAGALII